MAEFDFLIAGGGLAGLSLAYEMILSSLRGQKILIVDPESTPRRDQTWQYFTEKETRFDHLAFHFWDQVEIISTNFQQVFDIAPFRLSLVRAEDFYRNVQQTLHNEPSVSYLQTRINKVIDSPNSSMAQIVINNRPIGARFVFDNTNPTQNLPDRPQKSRLLKQYKIWEIITSSHCFDPRTVTVYDFRAHHKGNFQFFSVFPLTYNRARIEIVLLTPVPIRGHEVDRIISNYLEKIRKITDYRIASTDSGLIPLYDKPVNRRLGHRTMAIGEKAGLVTPLTENYFLRTQKDNQALVTSLLNTGNPFQISKTPVIFSLFNFILHHRLLPQGSDMDDAMVQLFQEIPIQDWFQFIDEEMTTLKSLRILSLLFSLSFRKQIKIS